MGMVQSQGKHSTKQRLHPGMLSFEDCATVRYGAVIGMKETDDGSDSRLRLYDIDSGFNTLVNFEAVRLQTNRGIQLATTQDPALVFVHCMSSLISETRRMKKYAQVYIRTVTKCVTLKVIVKSRFTFRRVQELEYCIFL